MQKCVFVSLYSLKLACLNTEALFLVKTKLSFMTLKTFYVHFRDSDSGSNIYLRKRSPNTSEKVRTWKFT